MAVISPDIEAEILGRALGGSSGPAAGVPSRGRRALIAPAVVVAVVALLARLIHIRTAYDVFIDEVTYSDIGLSVSHGTGVRLYGQPFDLHPAAVFGWLGVFDRVLGVGGDLVDVVLTDRPLFALFGTLVCVGVFLVTARLTTIRVGLAAGLVLAVDPFANLFDSRVLLEAPTQAAMVGLFGLLSLAAARQREDPYGLRWSAVQTRRVVMAAGLCGAIAMTSKETFGAVAVGTVIVLWITRWALSRRLLSLVLAEMAIGYSIYVVLVGLSNGFSPWWDQKVVGVERVIGIKQLSGFNAPTTQVTFGSRVAADLSQFASTYLIFAAAAVATCWLLLRVRPWERLRRSSETAAKGSTSVVLAWNAVALAYIGYEKVLGTIEEQTFYILLAPSIIVLACAFQWTGRRYSWLGRRLWALVLVVIVVYDCGVWAVIHSERNDSYKQLMDWQATHLPVNSVVAATEGEAQFFLTRDVIGLWPTVSEWRAHHVQYVLVATSLDQQGYSLVTSQVAEELQQRATVVFETAPSPGGRLIMYDVRGMLASGR